MSAHDSTPGRNAFVQHLLHYLVLIGVFRQTHAIALPIGVRPSRFLRKKQARDVRQQFVVAGGLLTAVGDGFGEPLELLASNGGLNVGQAVIEA